MRMCKVDERGDCYRVPLVTKRCQEINRVRRKMVDVAFENWCCSVIEGWCFYRTWRLSFDRLVSMQEALMRSPWQRTRFQSKVVDPRA